MKTLVVALALGKPRRLLLDAQSDIAAQPFAYRHRPGSGRVGRGQRRSRSRPPQAVRCRKQSIA